MRSTSTPASFESGLDGRVVGSKWCARTFIAPKLTMEHHTITLIVKAPPDTVPAAGTSKRTSNAPIISKIDDVNVTTKIVLKIRWPSDVRLSWSTF